MLLKTTDDKVLAADEELGEELHNVQRNPNCVEFNSLQRCNAAITEEIGVDYSTICNTDDCW